MATATDPKPQPYTFDLGHMLLIDPNPLPSHTEETLQTTARSCAQSLISQLLTTCPITSTTDGLQLTLPEPTTPLPREKHVPKEKEKTKWEKFAEKKGIKPKKKDGKLKFDEGRGEWVAKYGYKPGEGGQGEWLEEVDEKAERKAAKGGEGGGKERRERKMKMRKAK